MATTGELRAIIEELQLIDAGDAASFLGEEEATAEESLVSNLQQEGLSVSSCEESSTK
jgi:intracellular sulfur oxidation DsrE/DsrF family protein